MKNAASRPRHHRGAWLGSAFLMLAVALAGCGGTKGTPLSSVKGKVVQQGGQPLAGAIVMFMPAQGAPSSGKTDEKGSFELRFNDGRPGAVPGKHRVVISVPGEDVPPPEGGKRGPPAKPGVEFRKEAEVKDGPNDLTLEVSSKDVISGTAPRTSDQ
jgi:hypothetical protein